MRQSKILFTSVLVSTAILSTNAHDEQDRALQRDFDLRDKEPLSNDEAASLESMVECGRLKRMDPKQSLKSDVSKLVGRRLKGANQPKSRGTRHLKDERKGGPGGPGGPGDPGNSGHISAVSSARTAPQQTEQPPPRNNGPPQQGSLQQTSRTGHNQQSQNPPQQTSLQNSQRPLQSTRSGNNQQNIQGGPPPELPTHNGPSPEKTGRAKPSNGLRPTNDAWYDDTQSYNDFSNWGQYDNNQYYYGNNQGNGNYNDDYYYGGNGGGSGYADYYYDDYVDDYYYGYDDYYYVTNNGKGKGKGGSSTNPNSGKGKGKAKGGSSKGSGNSGASTGGSGGGGGTDYTLFWMQGFQESAFADVVYIDPSMPDDYAIGTVYLYDQDPLLGIQKTKTYRQSLPQYQVDPTDMFASVSGKCTRTDGNDVNHPAYVGKAYCQFDYEFINAIGKSEGLLTAEGPVELGDYSVLSVTGGTSFFRKVVGQVHLWPVNNSTFPAIEFSPETDLPASYYVDMMLYLDDSLIPAYF